MTAVYISIGNSDDKLTQLEWYEFYRDVDNAVRFSAVGMGKPIIHGAWASLPTVPWQNACWCVELTDGLRDRLRRMLRLIAREHPTSSAELMRRVVNGYHDNRHREDR